MKSILKNIKVYFIFNILYLIFSCVSPVTAQETFTSHLTRSSAGEGLVILHQDSEIETLVNGFITYANAVAPRHQIHRQQTDSLLAVDDNSSQFTPVQGRRMRMNGFRIQVYAGGNNRQAKTEAYRMANLVRSTFDELSVYTSFISPRWTCRVGDFKTREEAAEMLTRMRQTQKFREASIVKSQIIAIY